MTTVAEVEPKPAAITEPMRLTRAQAQYYLSKHRLVAVAAGRRSGKTAIAKRRTARKALRHSGAAGWKYVCGAPTQQQAKDIFWEDMKRLVPTWARAGRPQEGELKIELVNGAVLQVFGFDRPQRVEGSPVAHFHLDEYADMREEVWTQHLRPMLTDTGGSADLTGVPEGRNHFWKVWNGAVSDEFGEWAAYSWHTADVLPMYLGEERARLEIESAMRELDPLTFSQEYEASFNVVEGRVYYAFSRETHAVERLRYNPNRALVVCLDFNVEPGTAAYVQEQTYRGKDPLVSREFTAVIGEVWIPKDSNTPSVCRKIIADWGRRGRLAEHKGEVLVYGDPAGGQRSTKSEDGTDWDIARDYLRREFGERVKFRHKFEAPGVRVRVNSVNSRLETADGTKHMLVDPRAAPHVVMDFEAVRVKDGTAGEIDKDSDPELTHLSDGIGYYCDVRHPLRSVGRGGLEPMA